MGKTVTFSSNVRQKPTPEDLDAFVHGTPPKPKVVPMKRLTFDIPADLHRRMKIACVHEGRDMAEVIRELLTTRFP